MGCKVKPVKGIRYECPHCLGFSLCENCEERIPHEHNLVKIRHLKEKLPQSNAFDQLCEMLTKQQEKSKPVSPFKGEKKELPPAPKQEISDDNMKNAKLCYDRLTMVFGNDPKNFKPFLTENQSLSPKEAVAKYAAVNYNWSPEELKQYETEGKLKRVSQKMGKSTEFYREFVEAHPDEEVMEIITKIKQADREEVRRKAEETRRINEEKRKQRREEQELKRQQAKEAQKVLLEKKRQ